MTGALDGARNLALVFGAGARLPAGTNLALVGHKALQQADILVVDNDFLVGAKLALAGARVVAWASIPASAWSLRSISGSSGSV